MVDKSRKKTIPAASISRTFNEMILRDLVKLDVMVPNAKPVVRREASTVTKSPMELTKAGIRRAMVG